MLAVFTILGVLLPLTTLQIRPASANNCSVPLSVGLSLGSLGFLPQVGGCNTESPLPDHFCTVRAPLSVSVAGDLRTYRYDLRCIDNGSNVPLIHVTGTYNVTTKSVQEDLTPSSGSRFGANWICPDDPWSATVAPSCTRGTLTIYGSDSGGFDLGQQSAPFSTLYITASDRHRLNAELQNAPVQPAAVRVIPLPDSTTNSCELCGTIGPASAPAPTLPDFQIMAVRAVQPNPDPATNKELLANGMTAGYEVVVANLGSKTPQALDGGPTQFQVAVQITGSLQYSSMTQTPAGWDCSGSGPVTCVGVIGGYGDAVQDTVVTFGLQIYGAAPGVGSISAAADPNGLVKESDITNNGKTLSITVK
jgi:hypothetical protein